MILAVGSEALLKAPNFIYAQGIGRFMELIGIPAAFGISFGLMAFTTFVYDTLGVCTRLGRYIIEELTGLKGLMDSAIGTILTAGVPVFFIFQTMTDAKGNVIPAWRLFWNTFGASNQLLAALAFIGVSIGLKKENKHPYIGYWHSSPRCRCLQCPPGRWYLPFIAAGYYRQAILSFLSSPIFSLFCPCRWPLKL